jgi:hypothetical protein
MRVCVCVCVYIYIYTHTRTHIYLAHDIRSFRAVKSLYDLYNFGKLPISINPALRKLELLLSQEKLQISCIQSEPYENVLKT